MGRTPASTDALLCILLRSITAEGAAGLQDVQWTLLKWCNEAMYVDADGSASISLNLFPSMNADEFGVVQNDVAETERFRPPPW
jgi:hypothetical protein